LQAVQSVPGRADFANDPHNVYLRVLARRVRYKADWSEDQADQRDRQDKRSVVEREAGQHFGSRLEERLWVEQIDPHPIVQKADAGG